MPGDCDVSFLLLFVILQENSDVVRRAHSDHLHNHKQMSDATFTADDLAPYNGVIKPQIFLSVKGVVFDVTKGADFYGPGKSYGIFAGKEVSRCLGKMEINDKESNAGWRNLNEEHATQLEEWYARFAAKYPVAGTFQPDPHFELRGVSFDP